jgi:hypothetical protein
MNLSEHEANKILHEISVYDKSTEAYNNYVDTHNKEVWKLNKNSNSKRKRLKKKRSLKTDLDNRCSNKLQQERYNYLLEKSFYNREVSDFKNGNYQAAGQDISYFLNVNTGDIKYLYGYNFNHTGSPFYTNRTAKINHIKLDSILEYYQNENQDDRYYLITLTMPNLVIAEHRDMEVQAKEDSEIIKYANNVINNMNKKIVKNYNVKGIIKKFECTYKTVNGQAEAHPHYHLLISISDNTAKNKTIMKGDNSLRNMIFEYWCTNFLMKKFRGYSKQEYLSSFDMRKAKADSVGQELAGYLSKSSKIGYLENQTVFDHYYCFMFRKRCLTFIGDFKTINQYLNLDELDELDDDELNEKISDHDGKDESKYTHKIHFKYFNGATYQGYQYTFISEVDTVDFTEKQTEKTINTNALESAKKYDRIGD